MTIMSQTVTLKIYYDDNQVSEPATWHWTDLLDEDTEVLDATKPECENK